MHPLRTDDIRGRAAITPHRVGEDAVAVDLQQRGRVAEPADRDLASGGLEGSRPRRSQRDLRRGPGSGTRADHLPQDVPLFLAVDVELGSRLQVDEYAVLEIR